MRLRGGESRSFFDADTALVPLINVVFLLLLFFVLAGTFQALDLFDVTPPQSRSDDDADERWPTILLAADGRLAVGDRAVDVTDLPAEIERLGIGSTGASLKADARVETQHVLEVLRAFQEAGVERLFLHTTGTEGGR